MDPSERMGRDRRIAERIFRRVKRAMIRKCGYTVGFDLSIDAASACAYHEWKKVKKHVETNKLDHRVDIWHQFKPTPGERVKDCG